MKKTFILLGSLFIMMVAGMSLKAQEITITLWPGWNWISYPNAEAMDIATALGDFTPMQGDILSSQYGFTTYTNGRWRGSVTQFIPGWGYMYYSSRTEIVEMVFSQASNALVATAMPTNITAESAVVGGTVTVSEGSHVFLRGVCWGTEPIPDIDGSHTSEETGIGSFSSTLEGLTPGTVYYVRAYAVTDYGLAYGDELSFTTLEEGGNDHAYVDLGLPSGLLWATCNVGADNPEDYGDYFAWSETQPKSTYNWSTYQYCNGSSSTLTKYCTNSSYGYNGFTDNLTTLLPEDDAATANWGSDWRMPTKEEWQELYNNTTVTWTTQNGVNGRLFTASNGNSLFLPAAGYRDGSYLHYAGSIGNYWSSSLITDDPSRPWDFGFYSDSYGMYGRDRYYGISVRAVRVGSQNTAPTGAINGKFTINANGDQVYFSQGNLQYQASTNTWRFADNSWDLIIKPENMTIYHAQYMGGYYYADVTSHYKPNYSDWIDLFGWGTSGHTHGANCYHPWSTSTSNSDYYAYGSYTYNLYDQTGQADWGYNPISNGGNQANQWRTLTRPEWAYIFNTRTTSSGIRYAKAKVNDVNGVILLPDDWSSDTYGLNNTNSTGVSFSSNTISASQWNTLEQAGAVFLPAAGYRDGTSVRSVGSYGHYWSASYIGSHYARNVIFDDTSLGTGDSSGRGGGFSVRLARVAEN